MRVHLVQMDIAWESPAENFERVRAMVAGAGVERADLVVLPEMFATGFSLNVDVTADDGGAQGGFVGELAQECGATVVGGITVRRADGKGINRAVVCGADGSLLAQYDKIHPFSYGREHEVFVGGDDVVVFEHAGLNVCPAVCYDLRFPELFRAGLSAGAEAFAVIANWPSTRQAHWRALTIARAIENQAFVFAVNRCGDDPYLSYLGGSLVVGPRGEVIGELESAAGVLSVVVENDDVRAWRAEFPAWRDGRIGR